MQLQPLACVESVAGAINVTQKLTRKLRAAIVADHRYQQLQDVLQIGSQGGAKILNRLHIALKRACQGLIAWCFQLIGGPIKRQPQEEGLKRAKPAVDQTGNAARQSARQRAPVKSQVVCQDQGWEVVVLERVPAQLFSRRYLFIIHKSRSPLASFMPPSSSMRGHAASLVMPSAARSIRGSPWQRSRPLSGHDSRQGAVSTIRIADRNTQRQTIASCSPNMG